ncbi:MAG: membrane integrity-associated transporter subunit PqiC [Candidatus Cloacimonetes bacterium]|nr:membrane integrity-associated transporter subunit PqiC [Candidatus Cloacimonadota bacterium]
MKKLAIYSGLLMVLILAGCSAGQVVSLNYYVLEYYNHNENEDLFREEPFDYSVIVLTTKVPQTYNRRQIVIRHFGPRITYSDQDIWGVKLSEIIPTLVTKRLNRYNIFKHTQEDFFEQPDFSINTSINNLELYESAFIRQARLNMDFFLTSGDQETYLIRHTVNREKVLPDDEMDTFVQTINEIILKECDEFIKKMINYFSNQVVFEEYLNTFEERFDPSLAEYFEDEQTTGGKGLLLLPAITKSDYEPYYTIYDKFGFEISGKMGVPVPLDQGIYSIRYGSGNENQLMKKSNIEIIPRFKKIIEPDWGCLLVDVIDENRNYTKIRYEIFDLDSGESYGQEFPADLDLGEQEKIWVLRPGLYKITINNAPFNTYRDFTTVTVEKSKVQKLTIVVDTDEEGNPTGMLGAGVLEDITGIVSGDRVKFSSAIHANVNVNSDNEVDRDDPQTTITFNTQLDNRLLYDVSPLHYSLKSLIELGTSKSTDTDFRIAADDIDFKNTFIYYFFRSLGLYGRFDFNSHFFKGFSYSSDNFYYQKIDKNGEESEVKFNDKVLLKPPFFPIILKEGMGINLRILNRAKANLSVRAGFGLRQDINQGVYTLFSTYTDSLGFENRIYHEQESTDKTGTEVSLVGSFLLPYGLTYSTNADFLFPFESSESTIIEWENIISIKLFKYLALDYKLKLENKKPESGSEYLVEKHTLFLRVTYFLR